MKFHADRYKEQCMIRLTQILTSVAIPLAKAVPRWFNYPPIQGGERQLIYR
jgi:hypothetical protein